MMNKVAVGRGLLVLTYVLLRGMAGFPQAQPAQAQPATKTFVTVNFNAVVLQTAEAQRDLGALQTKFAPRQAQLQALNNEIDSLRKQLTDPAAKLTDAERALRTQTLDSKEKQLQREAEDFRSDSEGESQQVYQRIAQKVYAFLQTYAQQQGYSAVIERGSDASPIVWYAAANMDITDQLIKAYNAQAGTATSETPSHGSPPKSSPSLPESPKPQP
ncbi:MAG TPA: OmpH family outer membrane protein [Silvibacterium sp.]|nr:OmpH family outer membrane protein [Silvibacterium sp.]